MYKDYQSYFRGDLCGLVFKATWLDQTMPEREMTEPQSAGWWFEDMVVRNKSDIIPPELKKGGFNALFRNVEQHIPLAKEMLLDEGEIVSSDETTFRGNVRVKRDLVTYKNGCLKVIDIKTTGHLDNKWDYYGWGALLHSWHESVSYIQQKAHKDIQAKTYMCVPHEGVFPDVFEYWVFSSKDDKVAVLEMKVDKLDEWYDELETERLNILNHQFMPKPLRDRCNSCPLKESCIFKVTKPNRIVI